MPALILFRCRWICHPVSQLTMLVNSAGVSPSQASVETILKVDLYGTAVLLKEVGKVIESDGTASYFYGELKPEK